MKALVAGDRPLPADIAKLARDALVVGADGGGDRLLAAAIQPDAVVGDMDSLSTAAQEKLANRLVRDDDPGRSDLEKAVAWVRAQGADEIVVVSWSGGRLDHTLAALALAFEDVALHDNRFRVTAVTGNTEFAAEPATLFSLLALPRATVSVSGARWELARKTLAMGGRGLHNEVGAGGRVRVECHAGKLLLLEGNFRALHD